MYPRAATLRYKSAFANQLIVALNAKHRHQLLQVLSESEVNGVAKSRIRLPSFDMIPSKPGFSPHDEVITDKGLHGTYFWLWQHLFETNEFHSTVVEILRDLMVGQGWGLSKASDEEKERWDLWKKKSRFDSKMSTLLISLFSLGNAAALMVRETSNLLDLEFQIIPARGLWPVLNDEKSDWIGFNFWTPTQGSHFDPRMGQPAFLPREDVIFMAINVPPAQILGRAENYQAFNTYIALKDLHRILGVVAQRQTSRFIHWKVDTTGLSDQPEEEDTDPDKRKDSPKLQKMKAVRDGVEDRVLINPETGQTEVWDNMVTDETVTGVDLTGQADISGMVEGIETMKNAIDRKARIPPIFLATPGSSNRATSYNEVLMLVLRLKAAFAIVAEELEAKLFPEIGIGIEAQLAPMEEVIQEDEAVKGEFIDSLLDAWDRGVLSKREVREQLERVLTIGLTPLPDEAGEGEDDQAAVDDEDAEEAPADQEEEPTAA